MQYEILDHGGTDGGFTWTSALWVIVALAFVGAVAYGIWRLVQRRRYA